MTRAAAALAPFRARRVAPLFIDDGGVLNSMVLAAAYVVMALGLNVIVGFAGLLDLGYVAFFAIGAYTAAYFASGYWANADGRSPSSSATPWPGRPASTSTSCSSSRSPSRRRPSPAR